MPHAEIIKNIKSVVSIKDDVLTAILAAFFTGNHVLLEDNPGTGKTTLAKALAKSLHLSFGRVQFTPDLMPSDITGMSVYNQKSQEFVTHKGPVFSQILLADEINRASPKTQAALLEAMAEGQVTLEGKTEKLDDVFFVIATQNPIELKGTFPLPEAQMDRFAIKVSLGYLSLEEEVGLLTGIEAHKLALSDLQSVANREEVLATRRRMESVHVDPKVGEYIVRIIRATRSCDSLVLGAGPRASLALMSLCKASAYLRGETFVDPDLVKQLAPLVLSHRVMLASEAVYAGDSALSVVERILVETPVP